MRKPPKFACLLLRLRLSKAHYECIVGDLFEEFHQERRPNAWFWQQTLSVLAPRFRRIEHFEQTSQGGNSMTLFSDCWQDVRYSIRTLRKNPSFAVVAISALALGIGVNTGIFTLLNAIALRPLPVADSGRVMSVYQSFRGKISRNTYGSINYFSYPEYLNYRDNNHVLSGLAVSANAPASLGGLDARRIEGQIVSCNFFTVLGRPPVLGREFSADECSKPDGAPVAILSHAFWTAQFHADPQVIGSTILLNRRAFTVIGVAPPDFAGTGMTLSSYWAPLVMQSTLMPGTSLLPDPGTSWLEMIGRLKPGVSATRARADLAVIAGRIDQSYPGRTTTLAVDTATFLGEPEARTIILAGGAVALLAVGLVLLIACANVANLLLARAAARQKEIAIRLSAGASRSRLVRQLLTESILISLTGGALGSLLAFWTFESLYKIVLSNLPADAPPIALNLTPDLRVLGYAVAISAVTGILFGLLPALQATRPDLLSALKEEGSGFAGHLSRGWLRGALVVAQVSVCLVLLIAAGLLARGLQSAQTVDPGFAMKGVIVTYFDLEQQGYDNAHALQFHRQLMERVSAIPGIDMASQAVTVPLGGSSYGTRIETDGIAGPQQIKFNSVSPEFFSLLGIPLVEGRVFTEAEARANAPVAVISLATAKQFWPNRDPLGKTFRLGKEKNSFEVIGVARDIRATDLPHLEKNFFYFPTKLEYQSHMSLLSHTNGNIAATAKLIRDAAHSLDPNIIVIAKPLEERIEVWLLLSRILASLAAALGFLGLLLASVGIYGVVSYAVSGRIREIGIRMTLGAESGGILSLILKQGMRPVMWGLVIGFAICAGASRFMSVMLYGISPFDPLTFGGVALFLSAIAFLACYVPARRATMVDPMVALRYE
jgi:macrolide transport system ATP-binding/permease protein